MDYVTLYQQRLMLGLATDETTDDVLLAGFIRRACLWIDQYKGRRFDPRIETLNHDYPYRKAARLGEYSSKAAWMVGELDRVNSHSDRLLRLLDDALEIVAVTNGDGTAISASDYVLEAQGIYPKWGIRLKRSASTNWLPGTSGDVEQVISVQAVWGYHERYGEAWANSQDTVQSNPLTIGGTSLVVTDADGQAADSPEQRFQAGQLLKIDSEYLAVTAVNTTSNTLTVTRAANGSTAAAHVQGTAIYIYRPMWTIQQAALRLATWAYRQKDANVFERITLLGTTQKLTPGALPQDVIDLIGAPRVRSVRGQP